MSDVNLLMIAVGSLAGVIASLAGVVGALFLRLEKINERTLRRLEECEADREKLWEKLALPR